VTGSFSLFLFSTDPPLIRAAAEAGVRGFVVDWERAGKRDRQRGADTQINGDTLDDLRRVRRVTDAQVLCRINGFGDTTPSEVEDAVGAGADEILLPMVRRSQEVEAVLELVAGRCGVGILVETEEAVAQADELGRLPISRAYLGLNDLAIERGSENIFEAVADGTVEAVRRSFRVPFGFAGLTLPERGHPVPCRLLVAEMARLSCDFTFLRRSFLRDTAGSDLNVEVPRILGAVAAAGERRPEQIERDRLDLANAVGAWRPRPERKAVPIHG
jgi:hypothetical protein